MRTYIQKFGFGLFAIAAALILTPQIASAQDKPDLVITTDSRIPLRGSCVKGEPLWKGTIAIKNIGTGTAEFGPRDALAGGNGDDYALVVYVPQNIDLIAKEHLRSKLEPLDQKGIEIKIGEDKQKRCRFYNQPPRIRNGGGRYDNVYNDDYYRDPIANTGNRGRVRALQRALISKGYSLPNYGVDGDYGTETRTALRAYYRDKGETSPYIGGANISRVGLDRVLDDLGTSVSDNDNVAIACRAGARSNDVDVTIYAVVDPYNQIDELNEANNSATFTVNMDCSLGGN